MAGAASNRCTSCPRSAATVAAVRPAGPAPTTATRLRDDTGRYTSSVSWQARGLTKQLLVLFWNTWSRQAWLQAMQVLMRSARPCAAFFTNAASASSGRAMDTMSAQPSASTCSATSGVLMRLDVTSGVVMPAAANSAFIFCVTHANAARGTLVAMVGTRASCQPMPVLTMLAPPVATALPRVTISSHALPPGTRSIIDRR